MLEVNFMTSGKAFLLGVALLCGCGSSFTSSQSIDDGGARDDAWEASADDAETRDGGPVDSGSADASADVAHDAPELEASPLDAGHEAAPCAPVTFPLQNPCGGTGITGPGAVWMEQPQATPPMCFVYALGDAGAACELCEQTFNCSCIDPDGGLIGVTCVNYNGGAYLVQQ